MTAQNPKFNKSAEGSVEHEMMSNPAMAEYAWRNRIKYMGDQKAMEVWARDGFVSSGGTNHDITEGDHRQGSFE